MFSPNLDLECYAHTDCPTSLACISGFCRNPCTVASPCNDPQQDCQVLDHQPVCVKGKNFTSSLIEIFYC